MQLKYGAIVLEESKERGKEGVRAKSVRNTPTKVSEKNIYSKHKKKLLFRTFVVVCPDVYLNSRILF